MELKELPPRTPALIAGMAAFLLAFSLLMVSTDRQVGVQAAEEEVKPEALAGPWQVKNQLKGVFGCPKNYHPSPPKEFSLKMMEMPEMEGMPKQMLTFFGARYEMAAPEGLVGEAMLMDWSKLPKMSKGKAGDKDRSWKRRLPSQEMTEPDEECPYAEEMGRTMGKFSKLDFKGQVFMGTLAREEEPQEGQPKLVYRYMGKPTLQPSLKGLLVVVDQKESKCPCTYLYEWEAKRPEK